MPVSSTRIRALNTIPIRAEASYVLYWMTAFRRLSSNFALERAVEAARELGRPLVILEALRAGYPWASDRLHAFAIDGMAEHARRLEPSAVTYLPYVEPAPGAGRGLLEALARDAALVVADDFPCFFLPRMIAAAAGRLPARLEAVDSNGLMPIRAETRTFVTAFSFRAHLHRTLPAELPGWPAPLDLMDLPRADRAPLSPDIGRRWPMRTIEELEQPHRLCAALPIDHAVRPVAARGGSAAARAALDRFVADRLGTYATARNHPDDDATSHLSPWLHFGHVSAHEVFEAVMTAERWTSRRLAASGGGKREGWWGASAGAEAFLDQFVTWRELGFNMCATRPQDYDRFDSLPGWALATLRDHAADPRPHRYAPADFEQARTHDDVWNAAQRQLVRDGWMHGYLRMLWGKKILEWSGSPREALDTMIAIMDRHALDGRDPNSYAGYGWTLGRYDRPWAPARPIFGTVRYMSSANTVRKLRIRKYLAAYGPATS